VAIGRPPPVPLCFRQKGALMARRGPALRGKTRGGDIMSSQGGPLALVPRSLAAPGLARTGLGSAGAPAWAASRQDRAKSFRRLFKLAGPREPWVSSLHATRFPCTQADHRPPPLTWRDRRPVATLPDDSAARSSSPTSIEGGGDVLFSAHRYRRHGGHSATSATSSSFCGQPDQRGA